MLPRMDDPTGELRRQRDLVAAHLRWLDEQIAHTRVTPQSPPAAPSVPVAQAQTPTMPAAAHVGEPPASAAAPSPSAIPEIAMPEVDPGSVRNEVRRGCFIYVAIASLLLIVSVALAVWVARSW